MDRTPLHHLALSGHFELIELLEQKYRKNTLIKMLNSKDIDGRTPLHLAAIYHREDALSKLLNLGAKSDIQDFEGKTPLHYAIIYQNEKIASHLINASKSILHQPDLQGKTPLHYAVQLQRTKLISILLKAKAKTHTADIFGKTPLHYAFKQFDLTLFKELLKQSKKALNHKDKLGRSPIFYAVDENNKHAIELLIKAKVNLNLQDNEKNTPLNHAVKFKKFEAMQLLITKKAQVELKDSHGRTPFLNACDLNDKKAIEFFIQKKVNIFAFDAFEKCALHFACIHDNNALVRQLLQKQIDPNFQDKSGLTALHYAICFSSDEIIDDLLKFGASRNVQDCGSKTCAHLAIVLEKFELFEELVSHTNLHLKDHYGNTLLLLSLSMPIPNEHSAEFLVHEHSDCDETNQYNQAPLHLIATNQNMRLFKFIAKHTQNLDRQDKMMNTPLHLVVLANDAFSLKKAQLLLHLGANPRIKNKQGKTAFQLTQSPSLQKLFKLQEKKFQGNNQLLQAAKLKLDGKVKHLLQKQTDPNFKNDKNETALHWAVLLQRPNMVQELLQYGANPLAQDASGLTPLHLAIEKEHLNIIEQLASKTTSVKMKKTKDRNGNNPYMLALLSSNFDLCQIFFQKLKKWEKEFINNKNKDGQTLLHLALLAKEPHYDLIKNLIKHKVNINAQDKTGLAPLHLTVGAKGNKVSDILHLLLQNNARIDIQDHMGKMPLHHAVENAHLEAIENLIQYKANTKIRDKRKKTPLDLAKLIKNKKTRVRITQLLNH
ncbi:MAG: Phosphocholine transferase AnkX [Chlamydiae bacterium]|nr:Phosphocholine transferase AnkX [Chlamydiota bacterium]